MNLTTPLALHGDKALCSRLPVAEADAIFFATRSEPNYGKRKAKAKAVCAQCSIQPECLRYAVEAGEVYGIWGGLTPNERKQLRWPESRNNPRPPVTPANDLAPPQRRVA